MRTNWEIAARAQLERANRLQERIELLQHAMNLYVNNQVHWSPELNISVDGRDSKERFGIGIVRDCLITDEMRRALSEHETEDVYIVFWRTERSDGQLMSAYSMDEFKRLPQHFADDSPLVRLFERVIPIMNRAIATLKSHRHG